MSLEFLLALLGSYLLGAVPFGLVLSLALHGVDLREIGSGNIGATNAMRVLGKGWGLVAFLCDVAKGYVPVVAFAPFVSGIEAPLLAPVLCGAMAVVGHCFPVYLGFRGGKGVATACGAILGIDPLVFLIAGLVWIVTAKTVRFVSLASIAMGLTFPIVAWVRRPDAPAFVIGCAALALLIVVRHRSNIARLRAGTEPRMGASKGSDSGPENPHG